MPAIPLNIYLSTLYQQESRRILATLIRLLRDFDLAEEAMQEAFAIALSQWASEGIPRNPRAWLISTGRFKAIDILRRRATFDKAVATMAAALEDEAELGPGLEAEDDDSIEDDRLRLIFTCCHPALALEAQLALTLREVCGITTEAVARAFLAKPTTIAQRIVRAKQRIRATGIPYEVPSGEELAERLRAVYQVIYMLFTEGYAATDGSELLRPAIAGEAIRLARLLQQLLPKPEGQGLLALMILHHARRDARVDDNGALVLLQDQDRGRWHREEIQEGTTLVTQALLQASPGPYTVQAAIAAVHAETTSFEVTDWAQICGLYDVLQQLQPSPVVALNRAVAIAMRDGPGAALPLVDELLESGELQDYHPAHAARAELCLRLGQLEQARASYEKALALTRQEVERHYMAQRLNQIRCQAPNY